MITRNKVLNAVYVSALVFFVPVLGSYAGWLVGNFLGFAERVNFLCAMLGFFSSIGFLCMIFIDD